MKKVMIILIIVLSLGVVYYLNSTINIDIAIKINNRDFASTVLNNDVYKDINENKFDNNGLNNIITTEGNKLDNDNMTNDESLHKADIFNDTEENNDFNIKEIDDEILYEYEKNYLNRDLDRIEKSYLKKGNTEVISHEGDRLLSDNSDIEKKLSSNKVKVAFSEDTIQDIQESISLEDKAKLMKLVLSKLSFSDINLLKGLLTGGITEEERRKAMEFAQEKFNEEELERFMQIFAKYVNLEQ